MLMMKNMIKMLNGLINWQSQVLFPKKKQKRVNVLQNL